MANIRELLEALQTLREKYPATGQDHRGRIRPRARKLGEITEIQENEAELLAAICEKLGVKNE